MKAKEFGKRFDEGMKITQCVDISKIREPVLEQKRVNIDSPI